MNLSDTKLSFRKLRRNVYYNSRGCLNITTGIEKVLSLARKILWTGLRKTRNSPFSNVDRPKIILNRIEQGKFLSLN